MLKWAIRQSLALSEKVGTRFITVDAYIIALDFYLKHYFEIWPRYKNELERFQKMKERDPVNAKSKTVPLYFDLSTG
ncbi:MAG: hypothetical protein Q8M06_08645 [Methanobacteriaceae archaeon]|nr:hypothetical protein [Methanobacteriaceae archaeon]